MREKPPAFLDDPALAVTLADARASIAFQSANNAELLAAKKPSTSAGSIILRCRQCDSLLASTMAECHQCHGKASERLLVGLDGSLILHPGNSTANL